MTEKQLEGEDLFHYEEAWKAMRMTWDMIQQKRRAKAQECYRDARYHAYKIPSQFTDYELDYNIEKIGSLLTRGY